MRRFLALCLLAMLPLQFGWAAVAAYCGHGLQGEGQAGHHAHPHHADADADADPAVPPGAGLQAQSDEAPACIELGCGHCHGHCSAMPSLSAKLPAPLSAERPSATAGPAGHAPAPTRPERPQWRPLA